MLFPGYLTRVHKTYRFFFAAFSIICCPLLKAEAQSFALAYDNKLISQGFVSPTLEVTVRGVKGTFLVDTGAPLHVMSNWFALRIGVNPENGTETGETSGAKQNSPVIQETISIRDRTNKDVQFNAQSILIVSLPKDFQKLEIAGILSPQQLLEANQAILLNLKQSRMDVNSLDHGRTVLKNPRIIQVVSSEGPGGSNGSD